MGQTSVCKACQVTLVVGQVHITVEGTYPTAVPSSPSQNRPLSVRFCPKFDCVSRKLAIHMSAKIPYFFVVTPLNIKKGMMLQQDEFDDLMSESFNLVQLQ